MSIISVDYLNGDIFWYNVLSNFSCGFDVCFCRINSVSCRVWQAMSTVSLLGTVSAYLSYWRNTVGDTSDTANKGWAGLGIYSKTFLGPSTSCCSGILNEKLFSCVRIIWASAVPVLAVWENHMFSSTGACFKTPVFVFQVLFTLCDV